MELRHIRYFLALAEELNFTRAAVRLGIGQPPLSQQIKDLELEVGAKLFKRIPQGAELTDAGRAFLEGVRHIPSQTAASARAAQRAARGETGSVRVGFTGSAVFNSLVPSAIRSFRRRFPGVELTLREGNSDHLAAAIRDGALDAAFLRPDAVCVDGLGVQLLDAEPMVAAVPASLARGGFDKGRISLVSLAGEPFILTPRHLGPTLVDVVLSCCREAGFEPIIGQSAPQIASVLALVAAEFGVSVVPSSMQQAAVTGISFLNLTDVKPVANLAIAHRRTEAAAPTRLFVETARAQSSMPTPASP